MYVAKRSGGGYALYDAAQDQYRRVSDAANDLADRSGSRAGLSSTSPF